MITNHDTLSMIQSAPVIAIDPWCVASRTILSHMDNLVESTQ